MVVQNFLRDDLAGQIAELWPAVDEKWWSYCNPIEVKYAFDKIGELPDVFRRVFAALGTPECSARMAEMMSIDDKLEADPWLHGAGLHSMPRDGRLAVHLDYEVHPYSGKYRRLNMILYMNPEWRDEWRGETQIWDSKCSTCVFSSKIRWNSALIFTTTNMSWHGVPARITCPEGMTRNTIAYYWIGDEKGRAVEEAREDELVGGRTKARFVPNGLLERGSEEWGEHYGHLSRLCDIRVTRRLDISDLSGLWADWDKKKD